MTRLDCLVLLHPPHSVIDDERVDVLALRARRPQPPEPAFHGLRLGPELANLPGTRAPSLRACRAARVHAGRKASR